MPSQCAEALRRGEADVAIIPSIEYQRMEGIVALPGMAIAAKGEVRSLLVTAQAVYAGTSSPTSRRRFGSGGSAGLGGSSSPSGGG